MKKKNSILAYPLCGLLVVSQTISALDLSNDPLATKTASVDPNLMLLIDDSLSMKYGPSTGSFDMFYSPGFNFNDRYECETNTNIITPNNNRVVDVKVISTGDETVSNQKINSASQYGGDSVTSSTLPVGIATFSYDVSGASSPSYYVLADSNGSYSMELPGVTTADYTCSAPANAHPERCQDSKYNANTGQCSNPGWSENTSVGVDASGFMGSNCSGTPVQSITGSSASYSELNCQAKLSNGLCVSYGTVAGPIKDGWGYNAKWYRYKLDDLAFSKTNETTGTGSTVNFTQACFDPDGMYFAKLQAADCTVTDADGEEGDACVSSSTATVRKVSGSFLNWYLSKSSNALFDFNNLPSGGLTKDLSGPAADFLMGGDAAQIGMKNNTLDPVFQYEADGDLKINSVAGGPYPYPTASGYNRLAVAQDVAAILLSGMEGMNVGIATYDGGDGGDIDRILTELGPLDTTDTTLQGNRNSLISVLSGITLAVNTPLAEAIATVGLYYAHQGNTEGDTIYTYDDTDYSAEDLFAPRSCSWSSCSIDSVYVGVNATTSYSSLTATTVSQVPAPITADKYCQKNFIAALTDGAPYNDEQLSEPLLHYNSADSSYVDDVVKALYDLDLRPDINDFNGIEAKNNVVTHLIAFNSAMTISDFQTMVSGSNDSKVYSATSGYQLAEAFADIQRSIQTDGQSITAVALSSVAELQTENYAYQAAYDTEYWTGFLRAYFIDENGQFQSADGSKADSTANADPEWEAGDILNQMYAINVASNTNYRNVSNRKIFTVTDVKTGVEFKLNSGSVSSDFSNLSDEMQADINSYADSDTDRYQLVNYLRGDVTMEENYPLGSAVDHIFRQRISLVADTSTSTIKTAATGSLLGDIVNSSPVYVDVPPRPWTDTAYGEEGKRYSTFQTEQKDRVPMIYVGANDGMLHGIYAGSSSDAALTYNSQSIPPGGEVFAYLPNLLASTSTDSGLHYLASTNYQHRYYVDAMPTVSDIYADLYYSSGQPDLEWRTILVSGLRKGGKGFLALDITCPVGGSDGVCGRETSNYSGGFNTKNVLWEFGSSSDDDLGFTYSEPLIAKINYDSDMGNNDPNGNGNGRWAVIANNGYNSENGSAVLYIIFADGGIDGTWTEGQDYLKLYANTSDISTASSSDNSSSPNGLSSPQAVDFDNDGLIDRIYAGDLKGNMWAYDVKNLASYSKSGGSGSTDIASQWSVKKLFTTEANQPITTPPMVDRDPSVKAALPNLMVIFGTGQYLQDADLDDTSVQAIYAVHDRGSSSNELTRDKNVSNVNGENKPALEKRIFKDVSFTVGNATYKDRQMIGDDVDYSTQFGWYAELYSESSSTTADAATVSEGEKLGERLAFDPIMANQLFVFNSIIPTTAQCSGGASGWTMLIDWTTGLAPDDFATFDANHDGDYDKDNEDDMGYVGYFNLTVGSQIGRGGNNIFDSSGENVRRTEVFFGETVIGERLGWEEQFPYGIVK